MANVNGVFDALGDPTRRRVFGRLRAGSRSVGELSAGLSVTRSAVSQHLRVLEAARLVSYRREGTRRLYSVDQVGMALEQLLPFAVVIVIGKLASVSTPITRVCAEAFFFLRVAHAVGYVTGLARSPIRPMIYFAGWVATLASAWQILAAV